MPIKTSTNVYGDQTVTASELNHQAERILDIALERPVTITCGFIHYNFIPN